VSEVTTGLIGVSLIPFTQIAICPTCREFANFDYRGIQEDENDEPAFSLWNCRACGSTVSGRHILSPEREKALVADAALEMGR